MTAPMGSGQSSPQSQGHCIFCEIAGGRDERTKILFQDEHVVAFSDIHPAAVEHILVIPRRHVPSFHHLQPTEEDRALVEAMVARGQAALQELRPGAEQTKCGFHLPPLILVNHLHLHCMVLPHTAWWRGLLFAPWAPWWLGAADALRRLAR